MFDSTQHKAFAVVALSGHIMDSLTLTKVGDKLDSLGCGHQINDIQLGLRKEDISHAQISVWAKDTTTLDHVLEDLKNYGAYVLENRNVLLKLCETAGQAPVGAYIRRTPPIEIQMDGRWLRVDCNEGEQVILVDATNHQTRLVPVVELNPGDEVVCGADGIRVLPEVAVNPDLSTQPAVS